MMRNGWRLSGFLLIALVVASAAPVFGEDMDASLVFKAFRKSTNSTTVSDYTFTMNPRSNAVLDVDGSWNLTSSLADSHAASGEGASLLNPVELFDWSLSCEVASQATQVNAIKVSFEISGNLLNASFPEQSVGYEMKITAKPTVMKLRGNTVSMSYGTENISGGLKRGFKGSFETGGLFSNTYRLFDAISLNQVVVPEANYDSASQSFAFLLQSKGTRSSSYEFIPYYSKKSFWGGGYGAWTQFKSIDLNYSITRSGTGILLVDKAEYEAAQHIAGRYQATITATLEAQ